MPMRPWIAWNTPTMIIMIAANRMKPTAHPLVSRAARDPDDEYVSLDICSFLLGSAAGHVGGPQRTTERTIAPGRGGGITLLG